MNLSVLTVLLLGSVQIQGLQFDQSLISLIQKRIRDRQSNGWKSPRYPAKKWAIAPRIQLAPKSSTSKNFSKTAARTALEFQRDQIFSRNFVTR